MKKIFLSFLFCLSLLALPSRANAEVNLTLTGVISQFAQKAQIADFSMRRGGGFKMPARSKSVSNTKKSSSSSQNNAKNDNKAANSKDKNSSAGKKGFLAGLLGGLLFGSLLGTMGFFGILLLLGFLAYAFWKKRSQMQTESFTAHTVEIRDNK
ncbi:MAG: hypothetical protein IJ566_05155 [Cardiobacteriaceae bacterium]|nr:hypothetical protein [Cardiobacteriaceae bacterium]